MMTDVITVIAMMELERKINLDEEMYVEDQNQFFD